MACCCCCCGTVSASAASCSVAAAAAAAAVAPAPSGAPAPSAVAPAVTPVAAVSGAFLLALSSSHPKAAASNTGTALPTCLYLALRSPAKQKWSGKPCKGGEKEEGGDALVSLGSRCRQHRWIKALCILCKNLPFVRRKAMAMSLYLLVTSTYTSDMMSVPL